MTSTSAAASPAYRWAQKFLILIVDDDVHMLNMLCSNLETEGYRIESATDGLTGKLKAYEIKPDLIVADIVMPGVDGFSMMESINERPELKNIPIIFLSGKASASMIPAATDTQHKYALLKKPIFLPEFNHLIRRFLS
jgi:CheY-like chemotaxis protein